MNLLAEVDCGEKLHKIPIINQHMRSFFVRRLQVKGECMSSVRSNADPLLVAG